MASNGANLRLNSDTGLVAAVDAPLDYPSGDPNSAAIPAVNAAAYINSARSTLANAGATTLYVMDSGTDDLATQSPPNNGQLNTVGPLGGAINALPGIGFDIVTDPASNDDGIGGDFAYAVFKRPDTPLSNPGAYLLYDVNLATGGTTNGRLVGSGRDFTGGFAVHWSAPPTLDLDASNAATRYDPLTDGLLAIRYLFSLTGPSLTTGALGATATRTDPTVLKTYLDGIRGALDIDGNQIAEPLTDGSLIIRYLFGIRGNDLIRDAIGMGASRTNTTQVETVLQALTP